MNGAELAIEAVALLVKMLRERPPAEVHAKLVELEAGWPAPIGDEDLDAAVKAGLDRPAVR